MSTMRAQRLMCGLVLMAAGLLGCGGPLPTEQADTLEQTLQELETVNGLSTNGLSTNGLSVEALKGGDFTSWFNADPPLRDQIMSYLIACALPDGVERSYTEPATGKVHVWKGRLGLASSWGAGRPATEADEQVVSACLAAHANPYGLHVNFSVQGRDSAGRVMDSSPNELQDYNLREACFFGNLFRNQGVYAGNDRAALGAGQSSLRGCGLSRVSSGEDPICPNLVRIGTCADKCTLDAQGLYYTQCVHNGVTYRPLTSRIQPSTLAFCGDGVCQVSEHCGSGTTPSNCGMDCGPCRSK